MAAKKRKSKAKKRPIRKERWRPRFVFNKQAKTLMKKMRHVQDRIDHGK